MTNKKTSQKKDSPKDLVSVSIQTPARFNPEEEVAFATEAAKALTKIIDSKKKQVIINGEKYIEFEDWMTIARFFNTTVGTDRTKRLVDANGKLRGYEATATVFNPQGIKIGAAEASCLRDESNWATKPEFQLKSMAQTRACAKALRNIFSWVVVLAGFKPTPAEELNDRDYGGEEPFVSKNPERTKADAKRKVAVKCKDCGKPVTEAEINWSKKNYAISPLCRDCQKKYTKKL